MKPFLLTDDTPWVVMCQTGTTYRFDGGGAMETRFGWWRQASTGTIGNESGYTCKETQHACALQRLTWSKKDLKRIGHDNGLPFPSTHEGHSGQAVHDGCVCLPLRSLPVTRCSGKSPWHGFWGMPRKNRNLVGKTEYGTIIAG